MSGHSFRSCTGEPVRIALHAAGVKFDDELVPFSKWGAEMKPEILNVSQTVEYRAQGSVPDPLDHMMRFYCRNQMYPSLSCHS